MKKITIFIRLFTIMSMFLLFACDSSLKIEKETGKNFDSSVIQGLVVNKSVDFHDSDYITYEDDAEGDQIEIIHWRAGDVFYTILLDKAFREGATNAAANVTYKGVTKDEFMKVEEGDVLPKLTSPYCSLDYLADKNMKGKIARLWIDSDGNHVRIKRIDGSYENCLVDDKVFEENLDTGMSLPLLVEE